MRKTIKSNADISKVFACGKRYSSSGMTLIVLEFQHDHEGRVAFIAGKKNGNAVWRNAAKRRMRALCTDLGGPWQGRDVIFLAKKNVLRVPFHKLQREGQRLVASFMNEGHSSSVSR